MRIKSKFLSLGFKTIIVVLGLIGVLIQVGIFSGKYNFNVLKYYTLLSNVACIIYFIFAIIHGFKSNDTFMPQVKGALVMCITVTGLIYHFMLSGVFSMDGTLALSNVLLHYFMPIATVLDWLLFDKKGSYKKHSPLLWIVAPYLYIVFIFINVMFGLKFGNNKYPYPFFDIDKLGFGKVFVTVVILTIFFIALGYVFYFIDKWMAKKRHA